MAEGDVGAVIDTLEFDAGECEDPVIVQVKDAVYAIAYKGVDDDGFLKTVTINSNGQIDNAVIDSYEFDTGGGKTPSLLKVSDNVFVVAYSDVSTDGKVMTITIADNGQIAEPFIDSYIFDAGIGRRPHIIHVSGSTYVVVYSDIWNDGVAKTLQIADNGQITEPFIDTMEFAPADGKYCKILHVSGNVFAVVYMDSGNDCWIETLTIATNGNITNASIDSYKFHVGTFYDLEIIHIVGTTYAVVYHDISDDAWITTITVSDAGAIIEPYVDRYEFEAADGKYPYIVHISGNVFAIAYTGGGSDGWIKTVTIADDGQITEPFMSSGEFDDTAGEMPHLIHISGSVYAIAYRGPGITGKLATINIETAPPPTTAPPTTLGPTTPSPTTISPTTLPPSPAVQRRGISNLGFSFRDLWR